MPRVIYVSGRSARLGCDFVWAAGNGKDAASEGGGTPLRLQLHQDQWVGVGVKIYRRRRKNGARDLPEREAASAQHHLYRRGGLDRW